LAELAYGCGKTRGVYAILVAVSKRLLRGRGGRMRCDFPPDGEDRCGWLLSARSACAISGRAEGR
jgi:hypothetical protein